MTTEIQKHRGLFVMFLVMEKSQIVSLMIAPLERFFKKIHASAQ